MPPMTIRTRQLRICSSLLFFAVSFAVHAAENLSINIPYSTGNDSQPSNIVTVAKANGDFDNVIEALDSITDADVNNPYQVVIAPGTYGLSEQIVMKPFVSIRIKISAAIFW